MLYTAIIAKAKLAFGVIVCQRSKQPRNGTGGLKLTCKDCIHYEACHAMYYEEHATRHFDPEKHNAEKECGYFKDRSRFVELPCKVGDSYFEIEQYCTERGFYNEPRQTDIMDCEFCDVDGVCDRQYLITEKRFVSLIQIFEYKEKAADRYNRKFLTKEAAEQALKNIGDKNA